MGFCSAYSLRVLIHFKTILIAIDLSQKIQKLFFFGKILLMILNPQLKTNEIILFFSPFKLDITCCLQIS